MPALLQRARPIREACDCVRRTRSSGIVRFPIRRSDGLNSMPFAQVERVATAKNNVLDRIGIPGIALKGKALDADAIYVLAVDGLAQ